jgi:hypothetical protein
MRGKTDCQNNLSTKLLAGEIPLLNELRCHLGVGDAFCTGIEEELATLSFEAPPHERDFLSPLLLIPMTGCTDPGATSSSSPK